MPSSGSATDGTQTSRPAAAGWRPPAAKAAHSAADATVSTGAPSSASSAPLRPGPGERDHARARVVERRARLVAVHHRDQLLRDPRPHQRAAQPLAGERRRRGEQDRVAGEQRRGDLERGLGPRRRRGAEDPDHAARLLHARRAATRAQERRAAEPALRERVRAVVGEVAEARDRGQQLAERGLGARPPGLAREQQREVFELVEHQPRRPPDVARPGAGGHRRPQRLRGRGAPRGRAHILRGRGLDGPEPLAGGGRARLELHRRGR